MGEIPRPGRIGDVPAGEWDACANPDPASFNPFVAHAFLKALEDAGTVGGRTGWTPRHLVLRDGSGAIAGCAPCYLKSHSQGEYVFDYGWADAYMQAGGRYYPKLQIAVPFTPVPGPRLLVRPGGTGSDPSPQTADRQASADTRGLTPSATYEAILAAAAVEMAERSGISGVLAVAVLLSLSVELFQVYSHGRAPSVTDVLCNGFGAWLGALAARWEAGPVTSTRPRHTRVL